MQRMAQLLVDFAPGPLDFYRRKATFDWKKLKVFLDTEEIIEYQNAVYKELQNHSAFKHDLESHTLDELRHITLKQYFATKSMSLISLESQMENLKRPFTVLRTMIQLAPSSNIKYGVGNPLFVSVLRSMGTERHFNLLEECENGTIFGCFCLTEISHGTDSKGMRTKAIYDKKLKCFVMHSPDFEAAKCWAGNLGQFATHAIVFAQLEIDGKGYGLHNFVVPVRDPKTLLPYPGIVVGDMGEKIGLNGVDNGFLMFEHYKVSRECLLNKLADVTEDGEYKTAFKDPKRRHGASLGALSAGRVNITGICESYGSKALTIAIRYAGVRKQFSPEEGSEEIPILEYQTHQCRLLPYLAACYTLRIFSTFLIETQYQFSLDSIFGNNLDNLPDVGMELHAVSSASKPVAGWMMKDAIQECRETCGGHGYLKVAGIGDIRNDHDANLTYEGENHVLIQQTSNWLIKYWPSILKKEKISTPLHSADFLTNGLNILNQSKFQSKTVDEICDPKNIIATYQWLVVYLLQRTYDKLENDVMRGKHSFWAKNDVQVFYAKNLAIAFIQHFFLQKMLEKVNESPDENIKAVLQKLFSLFGLWCLEKHLPTLYQGEFATGSEPTTLVQNGILRLCAELKNEAISLVDVIAPPDFILNSVLGASDGMVYKHLESAIFRSPGALSRPKWWLDIVNWKENLKTKL